MATLPTPTAYSRSERRFAYIWKEISAQGDWRIPFQDLIARYAEAHRRAHTINHIDDCLNLLWEKDVWRLAKEPLVVAAGLFYHDSVYDTLAHGGKNERESANLMLKVYSAAGRQAFGLRAAPMIIGTASHHDLEDADAQLTADIDTAGLAAPWEKFKATSRAVREEYRSAYPDDKIFWLGNQRILGEFLERPRIFQTDYFENRFGPRARANLKRATQPGYTG